MCHSVLARLQMSKFHTQPSGYVNCTIQVENQKNMFITRAKWKGKKCVIAVYPDGAVLSDPIEEHLKNRLKILEDGKREGENNVVQTSRVGQQNDAQAGHDGQQNVDQLDQQNDKEKAVVKELWIKKAVKFSMTVSLLNTYDSNLKIKLFNIFISFFTLVSSSGFN